MDRLTITDQMIEDGMSKNGGWSFKQILLLGQGRHTGWKRRVIGKQILTERYTEFLALKDVHLKKGRHPKNSVLLEKALDFIVSNFTVDGKFQCPSIIDCDYPHLCDKCEVKTDFIEITGLEE